MIRWLRRQPLLIKVPVYLALLILVFGLATSLGAMVSLALQGGLGSPASEGPRPLDEQQDPTLPQGEDAAGEREETAAGQEAEAEYIRKVGDMQARSVETFLGINERLLRYDALTADDVEEVQAGQAALGGLVDQVEEIDPPQKYGEQYEVYRSAIDELHQAAGVAYRVVDDPVSATQSDFGAYDVHVDRAAAYLRRSNEMLGRNYETIEGA